MLDQTFVHIAGLSYRGERELWAQGCVCWQDLLDDPDRFTLGDADREIVLKTVAKSIQSLQRGDHRYFMRSLGLAESWRAYPHFRHRCVYLDIETDGGHSGQSVTTVGLYDGSEFRCLIKGKDLADLPDLLDDYGMIVTFFGAGFDLPMLKKRFRQLKLDHLHLDLCPVLRRVGLRGGLKAIERQLGMKRGDGTDGLNGLDAIRLWNRYRTLNDESALETLIAYNREDVVNLEHLAEYAYNRLKTQANPPAADR